MALTEFTYVVEPYGFEVKATAATQKKAHALAWAALTETQKDGCSCLDCVDEREVPDVVESSGRELLREFRQMLAD